MHPRASGVASLLPPRSRRSFPLDGGGGCAVGGDNARRCADADGDRATAVGTDPHQRALPTRQRLDAYIELAQPCRERVTENGVVKEVHVIVKQVPFSIHVRLPSPPVVKSECRLGERRCGKKRLRTFGHDGEEDDHHHHDGGGSDDQDRAPLVADLRGLDLEVKLRYDGEGGRAVPFVQRPPLDVIATRYADDGRSAVLTARVRALSSQHQNRLFVAHVLVNSSSAQPPLSYHADDAHSPAASSLPSSGAPSPPSFGEPLSSGLPATLEALTEPIQVISKPRSSRKRVVRRKRTLGDMLLECTQRIERAQLAHLGAMDALSKRCRIVSRADDQASLALPRPCLPPPPPPQQHTRQQEMVEVYAPQLDNSALLGPLDEDPQLMMLMDLPSAFSHSYLPASLVPGPDVAQSGAHDYSAGDLPSFLPLSRLPEDLCSSGCASSSSTSSHHSHDPYRRHHQTGAVGTTTANIMANAAMATTADEASPDEAERAAIAFLGAYAALPALDRPMAIRRVLRKYDGERLRSLASLLALLASRPPSHKRSSASLEASFQSCVCTACSYEAELQNIDSFYKDLINLEFSFQ